MLGVKLEFIRFAKLVYSLYVDMIYKEIKVDFTILTLILQALQSSLLLHTCSDF